MSYATISNVLIVMLQFHASDPTYSYIHILLRIGKDMSRYIKNLPEWPVEDLKELYESGKSSIDAAFASGEDCSFITVGQLRFIENLIKRKEALQ